MEKAKPKILVVEDAIYLALNYKEILGDGYDIQICHTGKEVVALIEGNCKFDLTIMDIVLPSEDLDNYSLEDCHRTGIRLIEKMLNNKACNRFYVITGIKKSRIDIDELRQKYDVNIEFELKIDHEPSEFATNVKNLIK